MTKTQLVPGMIAALCAALLSTSALAQSNRTAAQDSGFYIGAAVGAAKHDLKKADFGPVGGVQPSLDQSDRAGKVFGGYRVNTHLAVEAQYMDFGSATAKYALTTGAAREEYTVHAMSVAAVGILPVNDTISLFAKIGPAATTAKTTVNAGALGAAGTTKKTVLLAGLGATFQVTESFQVRAEYERLGEVGKAGTPGRATPSAFTVGVGYRF